MLVSIPANPNWIFMCAQRGIISQLRTPRKEPNKLQSNFESINPFAYWSRLPVAWNWTLSARHTMQGYRWWCVTPGKWGISAESIRSEISPRSTGCL